MSVAAHRNDQNITDSGGERVSVRASETARVLPIRPDLDRDSRAHARYHGPRSSDNGSEPPKVRNRVSPHLAEAKQVPELAWLTQQRPDTIESIAKNLIPAKGEAGNPIAWTAKVIARLFKLAVHCAAYTVCAATGTDKRSAVSACLFVLSLVAALAARQFGA